MPEHRVQVSAKDRNGLIIVVAGDTVAEMFSHLTELFGGVESEAFTVLYAAQDALRPQTDDRALATAVRTAQAGLGGTHLHGTPPPQRSFRELAPTPGLSGVTCKHGQPAKIVAAGVVKTGPNAGKSYPAFYACPLDRDEQCDFRSNVPA